MRVVIAGAGGQLGGATVRRLTSRADVVALTRREVRSNGSWTGDVAGDRRDSRTWSSTARPTTPSIELKTTRSRRSRSTRSPCSRWHVRLRRRTPPSSTTAPISCSTVLPSSRTSSPTQRIPRSVYGQSKLVGEWLAAEAPRSYVLRVESLFGGPAAKSSVDKIVSGVADRTGSAGLRRSDGDAKLCRGRGSRHVDAGDVGSPSWRLSRREQRPHDLARPRPGGLTLARL